MIQCPSLRLWGVSAVLFMLSAMPAAAVLAQADDPAAADETSAPADPAELKREQARVDRLWNLEWCRVMAYYVKHGEKFVCVAGYDKRLPSSAGLTADSYKKDSVLEQDYTDERGNEKKRTMVKPDGDIRAAVTLLPEVAAGQYGYIHSGLVKRIADDKTLELESVWLLDAEAMREEKQAYQAEVWERLGEDFRDAFRDGGRDFRRNRGDGIFERRGQENESIEWAFADRAAAAERQDSRLFSQYTWRVIGYKTDQLTTEARWPAGRAAEAGLQVVIVEVDTTERTVTAVPAATIGRDLTVLDAVNLLDARGVTREQFVDMVTEAKREARGDYLAVVLAKLEGKEIDLKPAATPEKQDVPNNAVELAD